MRRLNHLQKAKWIFWVIFITGGIGLSFYPVRVLLLTSGDQVVTSRIVRPGDSFSLGFLHSIVLSDIWDRFTIDSHYQMVLQETKFQGQGTGIPYGPGDGETLIREGNWFRLVGMHRVLPSIDWRVGAKWHNRFRFGQEPEIDLSSRLGNRLVRIRVEKLKGITWAWIYFWKRLR